MQGDLMNAGQEAQNAKAATVVQAVREHAEVQVHRRRCKTQRLERTLRALRQQTGSASAP
jgi:hypothetical protein